MLGGGNCNFDLNARCPGPQDGPLGDSTIRALKDFPCEYKIDRLLGGGPIERAVTVHFRESCRDHTGEPKPSFPASFRRRGGDHA